MKLKEKLYWIREYVKRQLEKPDRFCVVCMKHVKPQQAVRDETCIEICPTCRDDLNLQQPPF